MSNAGATLLQTPCFSHLRRCGMTAGDGYPDVTTGALRRVTSRRSLLKGLTVLMGVGAVSSLAAACGQQAAPAKPAESKPADAKPAAPAATTAPAPAAPAAAAQPTAAPKVEA